MDEPRLRDSISLVAASLRAITEIQRSYDEVGWDIDEPAFEKIRHIHIHLSKTVGKLAGILEPIDHRYHNSKPYDLEGNSVEIEAILADLLYHSAQIATEYNIDLGDALVRRLKSNSMRFCPESEFAEIIGDY